MRAIGPPLTAEESAALIAAVRSRFGCRFRHMAKGPKFFDCRGLVLWGLSELGRPTFDLPAYGREPHKNGMFKAICTNLGEPIPKHNMRAGDVVLMRFDGEPRHVGLLADYPDGGLSLIHTHSTLKFVTEHRLDNYWASNIVAVWRP